MTDAHQDRQADALLARHLLRGGVGLRHVRRTLRELRDHREDLVQRLVAQGSDVATAGREAGQVLGDRRELVAQMSARPELRSRARRFAWLLFVVGPVPMVFAVVTLLILALSGLGVLLEFVGLPLFGRDDPDLEVAFTRLVFQWVVPAAVGLLLLRAAIQRQMPDVWPVCAMAMVALGSACTHVSGVERVTGIHFDWNALRGMERGILLFCAGGVTYAWLRRKWHAI